MYITAPGVKNTSRDLFVQFSMFFFVVLQSVCVLKRLKNSSTFRKNSLTGVKLSRFVWILWYKSPKGINDSDWFVFTAPVHYSSIVWFNWAYKSTHKILILPLTKDIFRYAKGVFTQSTRLFSSFQNQKQICKKNP